MSVGAAVAIGSGIRSANAAPVPPDLPGTNSAIFRVVNRTISAERPEFYDAFYVGKSGLRLRSGAKVSDDNGRSWKTNPMTPGIASGLPYGFRRDIVTSLFDPSTGQLLAIVNALDVPGLNPKTSEPSIRLQTGYLRYLVSTDNAATWQIDEPMAQSGPFTREHPFAGVWIGTNSMFQGDRGCVPIVTRSGRMLVPCQTTPLGPDGKLWNPTHANTFHDTLVLIGDWRPDHRISWRASQTIVGDPKKSTRGFFEPTLAEFPDGRILMVMRGSNASRTEKEPKLPGYRWFAISRDGGETWNPVAPWTYSDGQPFFSPSAMSVLFKHSSGRVFWIGNVTAGNPNGNLPRWPVVLGEVDPRSLKLLRKGALLLDTEKTGDKSQGRLDLCHFSVREDRETKELIIVYPRSHNAYKSRKWAVIRVNVR